MKRAIREFADWRSIPEEERSPAPAWWWQPAFEARDVEAALSQQLCEHLGLLSGSTIADGAHALMATLAGQKSLPFPDEFPRKLERNEAAARERVAADRSTREANGA